MTTKNHENKESKPKKKLVFLKKTQHSSSPMTKVNTNPNFDVSFLFCFVDLKKCVSF